MKKRLLLSFLGLFIASQLFAQTPPARTWYYNDRGIKTTVDERWDEDGQGLKHGSYIKYFTNGEREILGHYTHDKRSGRWEITSYISFLGVVGKFIETANFQNDELHGLYKKISVSDGNVVIKQGNYTNGLPSGYWKEKYHNEEKVYSEGNYLNGERDGEWKNTFARKRSENEINFLIYQNPSNQVEKNETKTTKGYKTIFKNGEVVAMYDNKGVDLLEQHRHEREKQNQEKEIAEKERLKKERIEKMRGDFNYAMDRYQTKYDYYGDTTYLSNFLKEYPDADKEYVLKAYFAFNTKSDNDAFYSANNMVKYLNYQENFPNGIHKNEAEAILKQKVLNNLQALHKEIDDRFTEGNFNKAIIVCKLILRYKNDIHNSFYLPATIYYSLALWSIGDKDKAIEIIKPYTSSIINYNNRNVKFMNKYWQVYKIYKEQLKISTDKETYKRIKDL